VQQFSGINAVMLHSGGMFANSLDDFDFRKIFIRNAALMLFNVFGVVVAMILIDR